MRRSITFSLGLMLLLAAVTPALAQRTTGIIIGVVTDESGAVLPGVTVTLKGTAVPGTPTTVTTETGVYRFPALPPGTYDLTFTLQGFTTVNHDQIPVGVGGTVEINTQLKLSQLAETITVTGESPVVNTASTQVSTNYNREWVQNAPVRRFTFFDLINAAPGVSSSNQTTSRSTSLGSATTDNSYQLDGTDFTAPFTGAAWPWPNTDAIEEVEVLQLGASAEYGNVQGAVFNVVTRQGSNAFHGDGNFYYQHQNLTGRNTTEEQDSGQPYNRARFRDTTWQLGGPAIKDKLWFFGSYQFQQDYESQPGTPAEFPARSQAKRYFWKVNYQFNSNHKFMAATHDDFYRIPGRATALTAPSTISVENGHNPSPNVTYTGLLSNKTYIEARYSGFYGKDHGDPLESNEPRVKPRFNDLDSGRITGGIYSWYDGDSWKTGFTGKVSHFADNFMGGSHDLKFGVQYNSGGSDYITGPNDYIYTYGTVPAYGYTQVPWHEGGTMKSSGVYVDDTFRIGSRVALNLGVRYDYSKGIFDSFPELDKQGSETGRRSSPKNDNVFDWSVVSPRFGVNLKLNEAGSTVVKAHFGRYYRGIVTSEFDNAVPSVTPRFLFDGTFDAGGNPIGLELVSDNSNLQIDRGFDAPYTDQFIVGFEQQLMNDLGLQVNYVHKRGENYGVWRDTVGRYADFAYRDTVGRDASGQTVTVKRLITDPDARIFALTNDDRMFSRYNGATIQLTKRMSHNWQGVISLVFSKSTGRLGSSLGSLVASQSGSAGASSGGGGIGGAGFGANPNDFVNTDGRLIEDRPVVAKAQVVYQFPWGFMTAVNFRHQTGRLWSRQIRIGGLGFPSRPTLLMEPLNGDRRVPDQNVFDVRFQKEIRFGASANLAIFGDLLNLTNDDANESVGSRLGTSSGFGLATRFIYPRRLMVGAKVRF